MLQREQSDDMFALGFPTRPSLPPQQAMADSRAGLKSKSRYALQASESLWSADPWPRWTAIIFLSFVLSLSFLLIILACALWSNWYPLLTGQSPLLFQSDPAKC